MIRARFVWHNQVNWSAFFIRFDFLLMNCCVFAFAALVILYVFRQLECNNMQLIQWNSFYLRSSERLILKTSTSIFLNFLLCFWIVFILSCWSFKTSFLISLSRFISDFSLCFIFDFWRNICEQDSQSSQSFFRHDSLQDTLTWSLIEAMK